MNTMNADDGFIHVPTGKYNMGFLGNPGVGKSTLPNCLLQKVVFESGPVTNGRGLTTKLETYTEEGVTYFSPPGLDDPFEGGRSAAAKFTEDGLRMGGRFKLIFVLTTESGRIREADLVTKNLVLNALHAVSNVQYGIVVNKMTKGLRKALDSEEKSQEFFSCLNDGCDQPTPYVHFVNRIEALDDEHNALSPMSDAFKFFIDHIPIVEIEPSDVRDIDVSMYDQNVRSLKNNINMLHKNKRQLLKKFKEKEKRYKEQLEDVWRRSGKNVPYQKAQYEAKKLLFRMAFPIVSAIKFSVLTAVKATPLIAAA